MKTTSLVSLLVGIASLAGCAASGDVDNYKVLEEGQDTTELQLEPYGDAAQPGPDVASNEASKLGASSYDHPTPYQAPAKPTNTSGSSSAEVPLAADDSGQSASVSKPIVPTMPVSAELPNDDSIPSTPVATSPEHGGATTSDIAQTAPINPAAPSLRGIDRSHWNKIAIGPASAATHHNPIYFRDYPVFHVYPQVIDGTTDLAALAGAGAANYDQTNRLNLITQPLKFGADVVLLGWRMVLRHPGAQVTTP